MIFDYNYINDKGSDRQIKRQQSFDTQQVKTIGGSGGAGNNGDSGRESTIPDRNGEMQCVQAIVDCSATSIFMTPRLLKRLGISHQVAHITALAMTGDVMQHANDSRKTRITVIYLDYPAPVDRSDVLVVPMRAYDVVIGEPWFPKQNPDIDWARLTACDQRV